MQGPRKGPAANRNNGAAVASTDLLVFCDDDCLPEPGLLRAYAAAFESNPTINVLEGRTSSVGEQFHPLASAPLNEGGGCLWSCNFGIRRPLFLSMGGFDERFPFAAMEDSDLHLRLQQRGEKILFVKDARILHAWRLGDLKAHWRRHLKSQMIFLRLHPEEAHRFSVVAYWKGIARYYVKSFIGSGRHYGWSVTLGHQPLSWWGFLYTSYVLIVRPNPADMDA